MLRRANHAFFLLLFFSGVARAQDPLGWNSPRARELIERARVRRELPRGDSTLQNYQAKATGYVYFYLDRRETDERTLVKVDQIALDLFWKRPNLTKQRIVGMRNVSRLPNRMYYHLDHFTVVQNGFGDVIRVGDGDEVSDVPHPAAPGADSIYDYRLADSVTLQLGGGQAEVRVYEVQVRPKRVNRSALIGSVFVDRGSADIVRMTFTFTPASYVDHRLDYINISLDNGLFGGHYWLPNEQSVEIRRQIPELDFAAGAVIRGRLRIAQYAFNQTIPDSVFFGRPVTAVSEAERKSYPFPDEIYAGVNTEGLAPPPQMQDLRARAAQLLRAHRLSGLPPLRLYVPNASSVLRHDAAEGWYAGLGLTYVPNPAFRAKITGGYAFGRKQPEASVAVQRIGMTGSVTARAYYNDPRDIGPIAGMPGALNTLTSAFGGSDYANLYFTRGGSLTFSSPAGTGMQFRLTAGAERQISQFGDSVARLPSHELVTTGRAIAIMAEFTKPLVDRGTRAWGGALMFSGIEFEPADVKLRPVAKSDVIGRAMLELQGRMSSTDRRRDLNAQLDAGVNLDKAPAQYHFLIGGRETLPGYKYRQFESDTAFALGRVTYAHTVASPWLRVRLLGYAAYTREAATISCGDCFYERTDGHVRASAGVGLGLLWDVVRLDVVKGAHWQTLFSIRRDFWDML